MEKFREDEIFGAKGEEDCLKIFQDHFGVSIKKTLSKYSLFDFTDGNTYIELKTRRNTKDQYETTMIPECKIDYCIKNPDKGTYIFAFLFIDGLFYWKYSGETELIFSKGGRTDRGSFEIKNYYYLPVKYLKELKN